jgi:hypothetical protein
MMAAALGFPEIPAIVERPARLIPGTAVSIPINDRFDVACGRESCRSTDMLIGGSIPPVPSQYAHTPSRAHIQTSIYPQR